MCAWLVCFYRDFIQRPTDQTLLGFKFFAEFESNHCQNTSLKKKAGSDMIGFLQMFAVT